MDQKSHTPPLVLTLGEQKAKIHEMINISVDPIEVFECYAKLTEIQKQIAAAQKTKGIFSNLF